MSLSAVREHGGEEPEPYAPVDGDIPSAVTGWPAGHHCGSLPESRDSTHERNQMFLLSDTSLSRDSRTVSGYGVRHTQKLAVVPSSLNRRPAHLDLR